MNAFWLILFFTEYQNTNYIRKCVLTFIVSTFSISHSVLCILRNRAHIIVLVPEETISEISLNWRDKGRPYSSVSWMSVGHGNPRVELQNTAISPFHLSIQTRLMRFCQKFWHIFSRLGPWEGKITVIPSNDVCMLLTIPNTVQKKMAGIYQRFAKLMSHTVKNNKILG